MVRACYLLELSSKVFRSPIYLPDTEYFLLLLFIFFSIRGILFVIQFVQRLQAHMNIWLMFRSHMNIWLMFRSHMNIWLMFRSHMHIWLMFRSHMNIWLMFRSHMNIWLMLRSHINIWLVFRSHMNIWLVFRCINHFCVKVFTLVQDECLEHVFCQMIVQHIFQGRSQYTIYVYLQLTS